MGSNSEIQINNRHFFGNTTRMNNHLLSLNSYTNISHVLLKGFPPPSVNTDVKSHSIFARSYQLWGVQLAWGSRACSRCSAWDSEMPKGVGWAWSEGRCCWGEQPQVQESWFPQSLSMPSVQLWALPHTLKVLRMVRIHSSSDYKLTNIRCGKSERFRP